jgi:sec-independent protein translocase protein TatA
MGGKQKRESSFFTLENLMFRNIGPFELLIIVFIIMVLFGGKKIPELMHGLGKGINEFKRATQGDDPNAVKAPEAPKV